MGEGQCNGVDFSRGSSWINSRQIAAQLEPGRSALAAPARAETGPSKVVEAPRGDGWRLAAGIRQQRAAVVVMELAIVPAVAFPPPLD